MADKIAFIASLPPVAGAIRIDGQDGAARIMLDVPADCRMEIYKLAELSGAAFKVEITLCE